MGWVTNLHGQVVGLDTSPLIYYIEAHPTYLPIVESFFDAVARGDLQVVTSTVTLIEVLTLPLRRGSTALATQYRQLLLATQGVTVHVVSVAIAEEAARLRAAYNLRTPDAVQLAAAIIAGALQRFSPTMRGSPLFQMCACWCLMPCARIIVDHQEDRLFPMQTVPHSGAFIKRRLPAHAVGGEGAL